MNEGIFKIKGSLTKIQTFKSAKSGQEFSKCIFSLSSSLNSRTKFLSLTCFEQGNKETFAKIVSLGADLDNGNKPPEVVLDLDIWAKDNDIKQGYQLLIKGVRKFENEFENESNDNDKNSIEEGFGNL